MTANWAWLTKKVTEWAWLINWVTGWVGVACRLLWKRGNIFSYRPLPSPFFKCWLTFYWPVFFKCVDKMCFASQTVSWCILGLFFSCSSNVTDIFFSFRCQVEDYYRFLKYIIIYSWYCCGLNFFLYLCMKTKFFQVLFCFFSN